MSVYINNFLLTSNIIATLKAMKVYFLGKCNIKNFGKVKTIIEWQIIRDLIMQTMKIDQFAVIQDLVIEEDLDNCNANIVSMKVGSFIDISNMDIYEEKNLYTFQ